jgi:hypothetical protein
MKVIQTTESKKKDIPGQCEMAIKQILPIAEVVPQSIPLRMFVSNKKDLSQN